MSDLISRQTAINEISRWLGYLDDDMILRIQMGLRKLPSVQHVATDTNVGDKISRQAAIGEVKKHYRAYDNDLLELITFDIERLPSAQTEPKEGHWIDKGWNGDWAWQIDGRGNCWRVIECSKCGKSASVESNFCPHCGAYMKGGAT